MQAGLPSPIRASNYAEVARLHGLYSTLSSQPGWTDYMARLQRVRSDLTSELLNGSVDKFGNSRDNEKRAALTTVDRVLAFPMALNRQYEELHARKLEQDKRAEQKTGIHGDDVLNITTETGQPGLTARR